MRQRIVILGAGFAGLWSALGAARMLDELGLGPDQVELLVINRTAFHAIRVRNYEPDLTAARVPLCDVLDPIGVQHVVAEVMALDLDRRIVSYIVDGGWHDVPYDRMVFALGSRLVIPDMPGLAEHGFAVDTYEDAVRLQAHLAALPTQPSFPGRSNVLVVGAGLTGIETAAEMPARLQSLFTGQAQPCRIILADHQAQIGADMGGDARQVIDEALHALGIETRPGVAIAGVDAHGASLSTGERIPAATTIWCGGMRAHPLTASFPVRLDGLGRMPVDPSLRVQGRGEFAAGDAAVLAIDGVHPSVMSCQHARPMGRFAGHNVVCDLLGLPMRPLEIEWYATVLDLGGWGAVHTEGWDRRVVESGAAAKRTKQAINRQRIYPPASGLRRDILDAAAATVQAPPGQHTRMPEPEVAGRPAP